MNKLLIRLTIIVISAVLLLGYVLPLDKYGINLPKEIKTQDYKLGLDLQGGVELDYKVDLDEVRKEKDYSVKREKSILEGLKRIIDKRIENLNINDSVITIASYAGEKHIIVQIPLKGKNKQEDKINIERAKKAIGKVTKIIFKERRKEITQKDYEERKNITKKALEQSQEKNNNFLVLQSKFKDTYSDILIGKTDKISNLFSGSILENKLSEVEDLANNQKGYLITKKDKNLTRYIFVNEKPSIWIPSKDSKGRVLNDKYFQKAAPSQTQSFQPVVELNFNNEGAEIFGDLTKRLVGQQIAIFVGGQLLTSPNVNTPILDGRAIITGNYSFKEVKELAEDINTGVVPAPIYLTSEKTIDSKLGKSSLSKLIYSGLTGFLLIFIFLIYFYRISGFMASIALIMYVLIILAIVKYLGITLTLASIAGLILSVGMAIDANVLIFERIQDEIKSGEKINKAAKIGFKKSWSAIWDSNVTGLIVALILFVFGINMIKGFGLMLAIGIIVSLFSVMWISRILVFVVAEKSKKSKTFIGK